MNELTLTVIRIAFIARESRSRSARHSSCDPLRPCQDVEVANRSAHRAGSFVAAFRHNMLAAPPEPYSDEVRPDDLRTLFADIYNMGVG